MRSGKYWKPGSRFYGKTKQGELHVLVLFDDQSSLEIKTTSAAALSPGSKVKSVRWVRQLKFDQNCESLRKRCERLRKYI
jgi:hypothetical protein